MFNFEEIREDVGAELKYTAETIHNKTIVVIAVLTIIEVLGSLIMAIEFRSVGIFFFTLIGVVIQVLVILWVSWLIVMNMYAKGEAIHLLRAIAGANEQNTEEKPAAPKSNYAYREKPVEATPVVQTPVVAVCATWVCTQCGTENKGEYGQCKKCATYRNTMK